MFFTRILILEIAEELSIVDDRLAVSPLTQFLGVLSLRHLKISGDVATTHIHLRVTQLEI